VEDARLFLYVIIGLALIGAVALEKKLERLYIPFPLLYILLGWGVFSLPIGVPVINPLGDGIHAAIAEYTTEFIVIASLMAAGIAIDRPFSLKNWGQVWPLLLIVMPLSILVVALLGWHFLGLAPASAVLLAAVLSPTDPVLARSVEVGPPGEDDRNDVRFNLTVEAGVNDGLAYPFVYLAIAMIGVTSIGDWTWNWLAIDVGWRIFAGIAVGVAVGRAGAWLVFERLKDTENAHEEDLNEINTSEGLIVLGTLLSAYGLAELIQGYGFLAVFAGAVMAKQFESDSFYHRIAHHFIEQVERIILVIMLLGFGALIAAGILDNLTLKGAMIGVLIIFVVRPAITLVAQLWCDLPMLGRFAIAFLGVRGMGSLFYLAYGQNHGNFESLPEIWAIVLFTILISMLIHGITAPMLMLKVEDEDAHILPGEQEKV
jgi:NhaP-type Na+/H+ or K+/H+ antiporter